MSIPSIVDKMGRVVLPVEFRRRLSLKPGSRLRMDLVAERIEIVAEPEPERALVRKGKRWVLAPTGEAFDAAAAVRAERSAQARRGVSR